jgi:hypothetical protein
MPDNPKNPVTTQPDASALEAFLTDFEAIVEGFGNNVKALTAEVDQKSIAATLTGVAKTQVQNLAKEVMTAFHGASPGVQTQVQASLKRQAGSELARGTLAVLPNVTSITGLLSIGGIIRLIKKIIYFILNLIFGNNIPSWVSQLLELIDELIGAIFGIKSPSAEQQINQQELMFLETMRSLKRLQIVEQAAAAGEESPDR